MLPPDECLYTKPFVLAAAGNFFFFTSLNVYTLLPLYIQQLGGREGEIGTIMAMYSIAAILCQLGTGPLVDRFGRKPFLLLGAALTIAVSTTFVFSTRLGWHFYLLRWLQGAAFAGFMTSNLTLLADLAPASRRAEAVGVFGVSGLVTIALAPAAGEMVLRTYGFPSLFVGAALLGVATLAVCLATDVPAPMAVKASRRLGSGFWQTFTPVVMAAIQFGLANSVVFVFLPPFARYAGLARIGPFYIVYTLMAVAVRFLGGRLADRLERRQVILPSLVGLSIGVFLFSTLRSTWILILIAVINGTAHGFLYPAISAMAFDRAPSGARGRALAVFNAAVLTGVTTGAVGFGWLAELVGYRPGFVVLSVMLACGTGVFWRKTLGSGRGRACGMGGALIASPETRQGHDAVTRHARPAQHG